MDKPTVAQIAWIFKHLCDHLDQGGNFSKMMERLELSIDSYPQLMAAGAVEVVNILDWASMLESMVSTIVEDFDIDFVPEKKKEPEKPN
jgi:hypothetical protein